MSRYVKEPDTETYKLAAEFARQAKELGQDPVVYLTMLVMGLERAVERMRRPE